MTMSLVLCLGAFAQENRIEILFQYTADPGPGLNHDSTTDKALFDLFANAKIIKEVPVYFKYESERGGIQETSIQTFDNGFSRMKVNVEMVGFVFDTFILSGDVKKNSTYIFKYDGNTGPRQHFLVKM